MPFNVEHVRCVQDKTCNFFLPLSVITQVITFLNGIWRHHLLSNKVGQNSCPLILDNYHSKFSVICLSFMYKYLALCYCFSFFIRRRLSFLKTFLVQVYIFIIFRFLLMKLYCIMIKQRLFLCLICNIELLHVLSTNQLVTKEDFYVDETHSGYRKRDVCAMYTSFILRNTSSFAKYFRWPCSGTTMTIKLMKEKARRKHSLFEKTAASVLLKRFISSNELCHTTDAP